jgi:peptide-methionine (S)-S-oxide reductase
MEKATLAAGCFWCVEAIYQQLEGVEKVESGYAGGKNANPTYKEVCSGETGHAEVIQLTYDPAKISFLQLLEIFFKVHDPTTLNRQGADEGTQYRSSVFYHNDEQKQITEDVIQELDAAGAYTNKIVTQLEPFTEFYVAEDYHQNYFNDNGDKNPYCQMVVRPKVEKFQKVFKEKLKQ